jgi:hypothetical protein
MTTADTDGNGMRLNAGPGAAEFAIDELDLLPDRLEVGAKGICPQT